MLYNITLCQDSLHYRWEIVLQTKTLIEIYLILMKKEEVKVKLAYILQFSQTI